MLQIVGASDCVTIMQIRANNDEGLERRSIKYGARVPSGSSLASPAVVVLFGKEFGKETERDCSQST